MIRSGSNPAIGELYRRYARMIRTVAAKRASATDAEDIVQEVFLVVATNPPFLPAQGKVRAWLFGVAKRLAFKRKALAVEEEPTDAMELLTDREPLNDDCGDGTAQR